MAYIKTTWVNGSTPVDETNMNNIENGIANNEAQITALQQKIANGGCLYFGTNYSGITGDRAHIDVIVSTYCDRAPTEGDIVVDKNTGKAYTIYEVGTFTNNTPDTFHDTYTQTEIYLPEEYTFGSGSSSEVDITTVPVGGSKNLYLAFGLSSNSFSQALQSGIYATNTEISSVNYLTLNRFVGPAFWIAKNVQANLSIAYVDASLTKILPAEGDYILDRSTGSLYQVDSTSYPSGSDYSNLRVNLLHPSQLTQATLVLKFNIDTSGPITP